jgi:multidrug efflux pump subunit AcrA (membrane-fusion protein)
VLTTIALEKRLPFLRDGMTVDVDIVTRHDQHVLTAPTDAIRKDDKGNYILVVHDGRARRAPVTLGAESDTDSVVTSGLHNNDVIVAEKDPDVVADAAVKPAPSPSSGLTPEPTASD